MYHSKTQQIIDINMKKIFILLAGIFLMTGCTLDREPETDLADSNFWKSETDLRGACNKLYIDLPGFSHDQRSEELEGKSQNGVSSGNRSVPGTASDWSDPYEKIAVCNNIIAKGKNVPVEQTIKDRWLAEAFFFRAYHYFDLVKKYGDVPLILKAFDTTSDPDIKRGRDPRETVIKQCYEDLDFALQHLPEIDDIPEGDWGRVSQSAALGMIVRIGLYEGTHKKYHQTPGGDYKAHLQKAIDAAEEMIYIRKDHELYQNGFEKLFLHDGEGRQNKENIFVKVYGPLGTINHNNSRELESTVSMTRNMLDNFLYTDGLPREKSQVRPLTDISIDDIFINRDPRLAMTIYHVNEKAYKGPYKPFETNSQNHPFGYAIKKGFILEEDQSNSGSNDKMIIRYAEILISYAEALYERDGSISNPKLDDTVNLLRQRVGFNVDLTNEFVLAHQLNMLDEIRRERMVEFIDENLHYDDIIRWKTAEKVLPVTILGLVYKPGESTKTEVEMVGKITEANGMFKGEKVYDQSNIYVLEEAESRSFDPERDYLYPIPSEEIALSGNNIKQNPKWGNAKND